MNADLVVAGGTVVIPGQDPRPLDISVRDGLVTGLHAPGTAPSAADVVDATGLHVLPGVVDPHIHLGGYQPLDVDTEPGTALAAVGGVTSLVNYFKSTGSYLDLVPGLIETYEARSLIDARNRNGVMIAEAFMVRTHPQWLAVRELVRSDAIGPLRLVSGHFSYFRRDPNDVRSKTEYGGGALLDIGCYPITLSRWLFNAEPSGAIATIERDPDFGVDRLVSALLARGLGGEALDRARRLAAANPGAPEPAILLGDALGTQGDFASAAEQYRRAANLEFTEPVALRLIEALQRSGQAAAADQVLALFLRQNPQSIPALTLHAGRLMQAQDWANAARVYELLRLRIGNNDATVLNNLAWAYGEQGDFARAIPLARRAWSLDRDNPTTADTLGWILFKSGVDRARGLVLLQQAARGAPSDAAIRSRLERARRG